MPSLRCTTGVSDVITRFFFLLVGHFWLLDWCCPSVSLSVHIYVNFCVKILEFASEFAIRQYRFVVQSTYFEILLKFDNPFCPNLYFLQFTPRIENLFSKSQTQFLAFYTVDQEYLSKVSLSGAQACVLAFSTVDRDSFEAIESWKRKVPLLLI